FFFEESSGVTVYSFDGDGYRKSEFLKGATLAKALKKYSGDQPAAPAAKWGPPPLSRAGARGLDAHADLALGEVEPRLDGDDVAGFDHVLIRRREAEERLLVDVEADAVAERVDVAVERLRIR